MEKLTKREANKMLISLETRDGLQMTGNVVHVMDINFMHSNMFHSVIICGTS